jgi:hypothetical protein
MEKRREAYNHTYPFREEYTCFDIAAGFKCYRTV